MTLYSMCLHSCHYKLSLYYCVIYFFYTKLDIQLFFKFKCIYTDNKGNNKITELRTILQRESQNS